MVVCQGCSRGLTRRLMIPWSPLRTRFSLAQLLDIIVKLDRDVEIGFSKSSEKGGSRYFVRNEKVRSPVAASFGDGTEGHGRQKAAGRVLKSEWLLVLQRRFSIARQGRAFGASFRPSRTVRYANSRKRVCFDSRRTKAPKHTSAICLGTSLRNVKKSRKPVRFGGAGLP